MSKALSVFFVVFGAFFLGYAVTASVLLEFTTSRAILCCTSIFCVVTNAINLIED